MILLCGDLCQSCDNKWNMTMMRHFITSASMKFSEGKHVPLNMSSQIIIINQVKKWFPVKRETTDIKTREKWWWNKYFFNRERVWRSHLLGHHNPNISFCKLEKETTSSWYFIYNYWCNKQFFENKIFHWYVIKFVQVNTQMYNVHNCTCVYIFIIHLDNICNYNVYITTQKYKWKFKCYLLQ